MKDYFYPFLTWSQGGIEQTHPWLRIFYVEIENYWRYKTKEKIMKLAFKSLSSSSFWPIGILAKFLQETSDHRRFPIVKEIWLTLFVSKLSDGMDILDLFLW